MTALSELVEIVKLQKLGSPGSYYLLVPREVIKKLDLHEGVEFLLFVDFVGGRLVYQLKRRQPEAGEAKPVVEVPAVQG